MNAVVDTNVVAYYLLNTEPHAEECREFWKHIGDVAAPASWQAEILNVVWMAARTRVITPDESVTKLRAAARLGIQPVPVRQLWRGALIRSIHSGISPYDVLFVELAIRRHVKLATFHAQLLRTFPEVAKRPSEIY
jgi:predicted nucleic acid-binding protein